MAWFYILVKSLFVPRNLEWCLFCYTCRFCGTFVVDLVMVIIGNYYW